MSSLETTGGIAPNNLDRTFDFVLFRRILRRRVLAWAVFGPVVFAGMLLYNLYFVPQTFTGETSMSMQQTNGGTLALTFLGSQNTGAGRYLGILRSRSFAEQVEQIVNLSKRLDLGSHEAAVWTIMQGTKVEESQQDGLLYVRVSLDAPPRSQPDPTNQREKVRKAASLIANVYTEIFRQYLENTDTDHDAVLRREATKFLDQAKAQYEAAIRSYTRLASARHNNSSSDASAEDIPITTATLTELYKKQGELISGIRAAEVAQQAMTKLLLDEKASVPDLPSEDPLLTQARTEATKADQELKSVLTLYKEGHPKVITARENLRVANENLQRQMRSMGKNKTSDVPKLASLRSQLATVQSQITEAERKQDSSRVHVVEIEQSKKEIEIAGDMLKSAGNQYAIMSFQTVAGQNRMAVIDKAIVPKVSKPTLSVIIIISLLAAFASVALWFALEYAAQLTRPVTA